MTVEILYPVRMTLHELFHEYHIHRPIDLAKRTGMSRSHVHLLWHGYRHISRNMAKKISEATGIPYLDLLAAEPPTPPPKNPSSS